MPSVRPSRWESTEAARRRAERRRPGAGGCGARRRSRRRPTRAPRRRTGSAGAAASIRRARKVASLSAEAAGRAGGGRVDGIIGAELDAGLFQPGRPFLRVAAVGEAGPQGAQDLVVAAQEGHAPIQTSQSAGGQAALVGIGDQFHQAHARLPPRAPSLTEPVLSLTACDVPGASQGQNTESVEEPEEQVFGQWVGLRGQYVEERPGVHRMAGLGGPVDRAFGGVAGFQPVSAQPVRQLLELGPGQGRLGPGIPQLLDGRPQRHPDSRGHLGLCLGDPARSHQTAKTPPRICASYVDETAWCRAAPAGSTARRCAGRWVDEVVGCPST